MLTVPKIEKDFDWKKRNAEAIKTFGWAVLEIYKELYRVRKRTLEEDAKPKEQKSKLIRPGERT